MKKNLIAIAVIVTLTIGNSFAQTNKYSKSKVEPVRELRNDYQNQDSQIKHLDKIVGLTHKQENEVRKIENKYDRLFKNQRNASNFKILESNKNKEIFAVLNPYQRKKLVAFQNSQNWNYKYSRKG